MGVSSCFPDSLCLPRMRLELPKLALDGPFTAPTQTALEHEFIIAVGAGVGITPFLSFLSTIINRVRASRQLASSNNRKQVPIRVAHFFGRHGPLTSSCSRSRCSQTSCIQISVMSSSFISTLLQGSRRRTPSHFSSGRHCVDRAGLIVGCSWKRPAGRNWPVRFGSRSFLRAGFTATTRMYSELMSFSMARPEVRKPQTGSCLWSSADRTSRWRCSRSETHTQTMTCTSSLVATMPLWRISLPWPRVATRCPRLLVGVSVSRCTLSGFDKITAIV